VFEHDTKKGVLRSETYLTSDFTPEESKAFAIEGETDERRLDIQVGEPANMSEAAALSEGPTGTVLDSFENPSPFNSTGENVFGFEDLASGDGTASDVEAADPTPQEIIEKIRERKSIPDRAYEETDSGDVRLQGMISATDDSLYYTGDQALIKAN